MNKTTITCGRPRRSPWRACRIGLTLALICVALAGCGVLDILVLTGMTKSRDSVSGSATGTQESARFVIADNYLYAVTSYGYELQIFDITTASNPVAVNIQNIGRDIKTISSYNKYLFIGSWDGMNIYDSSNPQLPLKVGPLLQVGGCDPVVVEGNYAYAAIGGGTTQSTSAGTTSELDVININMISAPVLVKSYPMQGPSAIAADSGKVFICDGPDGLKVYDVADPENIVLIQQIAGQNCYDLVPGNNHLVVSGSDGLYQYDYTAFPMTELSRL